MRDPIKKMWAGDYSSAGAVKGSFHRWLAPHSRRRTAQGKPPSRRARVFAAALCGFGFVLFPGLGVLAIQACLVLAGAYLMVSLVVGGLRGASHGLR